ncbi:MAG: THUMP domain-containing protein [Conchiformibius sp.]|nr:THUMP domain-containing protein [Conchiformibius sp.]
MKHTLFATCPRGLETLLAAELSAQGCTDVAPGDGGVSFRADWAQTYRANLHSRTASRILLRVAHGRYRNEHDLYALAKTVPWPQWFDVEQTFRIHCEGKRARVKSLEFTALKIKDAVCDVFREHGGSRPSVAKQRPDVRIHAFVGEHEAALLIDTSGEALFKRGYRQDSGEAPLRENLAAGLLLAAGYDGTQPFQDPFCGSGTLAIEAAWIALNRAPGLLRRFGFERLRPFERELWQRIRSEAEAAVRDRTAAPIAASDNDRAMTRTALANARAAHADACIRFDTADALDVRPPADGGIMLSNPPYGVRLAEVQALHALYPQLGAWLKQHYAGWRIGMFTGDREMPKLMRLSPSRKIPFYNGQLDCRLFILEMVAGSNRPRVQAA